MNNDYSRLHIGYDVYTASNATEAWNILSRYTKYELGLITIVNYTRGTGNVYNITRADSGVASRSSESTSTEADLGPLYRLSYHGYLFIVFTFARNAKLGWDDTTLQFIISLEFTPTEIRFVYSLYRDDGSSQYYKKIISSATDIQFCVPKIIS